MDNYVDKEFEELLDSVESINDQFIKDFYNNEEIQGESLDEAQDLEQISPVENFEEKAEENIISQTNLVENLDFSTSNLSETDLNSLIISPIELDSDMLAESLNVENIDETIETEEKFEELENIEPVENSSEDILKLLDKSKNSEDFFEKLEEKIDD